MPHQRLIPFFMLLACLMSARAGVAQQNAPSFFYTTPTTAPSSMGLLGRLLDETHVVEVGEVIKSSGGITVNLTLGQGVSVTHRLQGGGGSSEEKFISSLQSGHRYRFPHCVIDELGIDNVVNIARAMPGKPLHSIKTEKPFRAVVLDQGLGMSHYSIIIREAGGRLRHFHGSFEDAGAKEAANLLFRGRSFEFPAVLEDALRSKEERQTLLKPKNPETAPLFRYLGEWSGGMDGKPQAKVSMDCHPRADGSGIWREVTFSDGSEEVPPLPDITHIEYDRSEPGYMASSVASDGPPPLKSTWDENTRTFTTVLSADERGRKRVNTATFTRDDRIDWKTITQSQKGETLSSSSGYYNRLQTLDLSESNPLPPTEYPGDAPMMAPFLFAQELPGLQNTHQLRPSQLSSCPPFRALVGTITIKEDSLDVQLRHMNGNYMTLTEKEPGIGNGPLAKALAQLKRGQSYEFPFCILHPGKEEAGKPTTPEMKALEIFIGKWSFRRHETDGKLSEVKASVRSFWSAEGTAMWRETHNFGGTITDTNGKTLPTLPHTSFTHITHDPATREYVETQIDRPQMSPIRGTWDAEKRAYSWKCDIGPIPDVKPEGGRTFATPDRIEWRERQLNADGSAKFEYSGIYERIKE